MRKSLIFGLVLLVFFSAKVLAVPAAPIVHELKNADGSTFKAKLVGDEWANWFETLDGYTVVLNESSGNWEYAILKDGRLAPSGAVVGKIKPIEESRSLRPVTQKGALMAPAFLGSDVKAPVEGTIKVPVILIDFPDETATYSTTDFENLLFNKSNPVSMWAYYNEVSYNKLDVTGTVSGWYRSKNSSCYYGYQNGHLRAAELVKEAVQKADPYINFSHFDSNGDGYVDAVIVVHAGEGAEASGNYCDIWSHKWDLRVIGGYVTDDGVEIAVYTIQPEKLYGELVTIGVFCHEFGHVLGLPDLYDRDKSSAGVGVWDLMSFGNWNGIKRPGDSPAHLSAWCKWYLGWVNPVLITDRAHVIIPNVEQNPVVYQLLPNPNGPWDWYLYPGGVGEYFLVENRYKIGFDAALPGEGLLIWHIDESMTSNDDETHKLVDLEEADGRNDLDKKINRGDSTDPWYSNIAGFTENSNPNSNFYNGTPSFVRVYNISPAGSLMTATMEVKSQVTEPTWTEVISDLEEGVDPDLQGVDVNVTDEYLSIRIRTYNEINVSNFVSITLLDIDRNPDTGYRAQFDNSRVYGVDFAVWTIPFGSVAVNNFAGVIPVAERSVSELAGSGSSQIVVVGKWNETCTCFEFTGVSYWVYYSSNYIWYSAPWALLCDRECSSMPYIALLVGNVSAPTDIGIMGGRTDIAVVKGNQWMIKYDVASVTGSEGIFAEKYFYYGPTDANAWLAADFDSQ
uniref:M6 family metalloprotease domain-containing protein n=1 Tax=Archaeoglobus fulgidus TaxID=2234 RepID=A0A7C3RE12_ARCFL